MYERLYCLTRDVREVDASRPTAGGLELNQSQGDTLQTRVDHGYRLSPETSGKMSEKVVYSATLFKFYTLHLYQAGPSFRTSLLKFCELLS